MAENDIGSLVVLKPEGQDIAGIVTERGRCFVSPAHMYRCQCPMCQMFMSKSVLHKSSFIITSLISSRTLTCMILQTA